MCETCRGSHHGQLDLAFVAMFDGHEVGALEYSVCRGVAHIAMVAVAPEFRRRGIARAMVDALYAHFGRRTVRWGWTTAEGRALQLAVARDWRIRARGRRR